MANILGLHFAHDGGACIFKNNKIVVAISSERLTRKKKFYGINDEVLDYVLEVSSLSIEDIDFIAFTDYFKVHSNNIVKLFNEKNIEIQVYSQVLFGNDADKELYMEIRDRKIPVVAISHHMAHCASTFYTSPFKEAVCFSLDASMGHIMANSLIAIGNENSIKAVTCPGIMSGVLYAKFTENLGIGNPLFKAGSTMGLAAYGQISSQVITNIDAYIARCFFKENDKYEKEFSLLWKHLARTENLFSASGSNTQDAMDIAADLQFVFERSILKAVTNIKNNNILNLCLSGGSMLNCNVNSLILKQSQFKNIHLFPACGDDGLCVGACLFLAHNILKIPRYSYKASEICYLGRDYDSKENILDFDLLAKKLNEGKIIAWHNGKSEYGPRALGRRSLLSDPRSLRNRDILNFVIKRREWFRPFAPVVLEEKCQDWFDFSAKSPYMLFTARAKRPKEVPAVVHIDNSARMQTLNQEINLDYFNLVKAFDNLTQIPILLNTSLNGHNEPILETEKDAIKFFNKYPVDIMVLNNKIYEK
ncbi:MAG: carbamoyltransferase C-terminal domain-containing protein [Nanoarchaeota archaeon]